MNALNNLVELNSLPTNVKNWRPQFLLIQSMTPDDVEEGQAMVDKPLLLITKTLTMSQGAPQIIAAMEPPEDFSHRYVSGSWVVWITYRPNHTIAFRPHSSLLLPRHIFVVRRFLVPAPTCRILFGLGYG